MITTVLMIKLDSQYKQVFKVPYNYHGARMVDYHSYMIITQSYTHTVPSI